MPKLNVENGRVTDATDHDRVCQDCDTPALPPSYDYCPYCGSELDA